MSTFVSKQTEDVRKCSKNFFQPLGIEIYFFKACWYNKIVDDAFKFKVSDDTVCAVLVTIPSFFENAFLPYVRKISIDKLEKDPIDLCIAYHVGRFQNYMDDLKMLAMYDYELLPSRRPKVLVQTAAHVAGAAFYYQRKHVAQHNIDADHPAGEEQNSSDNLSMQKTNGDDSNVNISGRSKDPWGQKRIFGCCMHPVYGGWFAIRCVIIFSNFLDPHLKYTCPIDCVPTREGRIELLDRFNGNWQDNTYRDVIPVKDCYSEIQKYYFATPPKDRKNLLLQMLTDC